MAAIVLDNERHKWLERERNTWSLVRACFAAYMHGEKPTADKLRALCSLTWITRGEDNTQKVTFPALCTLTGKQLDACKFSNLSGTLAKAHIPPAIVNASKNPTGFVNFRNPYRNSCLDWFGHRTREIYDLFERAYVLKSDEDGRSIYAEIAKLDRVGYRKGSGGLHPENLLTPVIACLDPRIRCPIINGRKEVKDKFKAIGVKRSSLPEQFWALVNLIHYAGIEDAFMLDIITPEELAGVSPSTQSNKSYIKLSVKERQLEEKDENEVAVLRKASLSSYIIVHNSMTNRLQSCCKSSGRQVHDWSSKDCCFDALIKNYDGDGRDLLIEAKSSTDVAFCRMAVGQLFDYRRLLPGSATTDLAVLFPDRPGKHVRDFLGHIGIKALWFTGDKIVDASGSILVG